MSAEDLPFTLREIALMDTVDGMARVLWRRYYREIRLWWRAEFAQMEHDIIHGTGDPTLGEPIGILNCAGLQQGAR